MIINQWSQWLMLRSRAMKQLILMLLDIAVIIFSLWLAFSLRYSQWYIPPEKQYWIFAFAPIIAIPIFSYFGLYHAVVRYIGTKALWSVMQATVL
ncbi:MAG TPA: polysaccharide biosynthesis protein, partial [Gammaproteobacteria bacterium]|nr:polysaccharide biosynthesis protein [Gammaproteobacteria bacterium]